MKRLFGKKSNKISSSREIPTDVIIPRNQHSISKTDIRRNALKVLNRLHSAGYDAYLVGGSVRDLLLRIDPKDFDVATNAHPEDIKKCFRNCRLIGKRFRLAHIHFGREIIEVATFRAIPKKDTEKHHKSEHGRLLRDNVYGDIHDDAWRRDITINALYYNIADFSIVDFTQGYRDLQHRVVRIIGDAEERYREDPVRMIRVIRFAAKLDFTIEENTAAAIHTCAALLENIPPSRLFEEAIKLYHSGAASKIHQLLVDYNLYQHLFPQSWELLQDDNFPTCKSFLTLTLANTDERIDEQKPVTPAFFLAVLLWHPLLKQQQHWQDQGLPPLPALEKAMNGVISQQAQALSIPRRFTQVMREIWMLQYRLPRRYGRRALQILEHPRFRAAYDFLLLRCAAGEENEELGNWWTQFQEVDENTRDEMMAEFNRQHNTKPPRRRKRRKPS